MRRRLLLALVGLTAAILIGAVIPLGLRASAHDYAGYLEDAQSRARMAAAAEELLADHVSGAELSQDLTAAAHGGDGLAILSPGGAHVIRRAGPPVAVPSRLISQAERTDRAVTDVSRDRMLVVVPVRSGGQTVGIVALLRPTERLEYGLRTFWMTLVLIAVAALAAAVLIGLGLSRWAARPLVADDGPGMSEAEMDRAFRRFATSTPGGSGLGLAIVYRLASSSGGSARLTRTEGGGLTAIVDLPRASPVRSALPGRIASRVR